MNTYTVVALNMSGTGDHDDYREFDVEASSEAHAYELATSMLIGDEDIMAINESFGF